MRDKPIGVFDSGIGGLTCAKQLLKLLPNENMIFLGDTARSPYGIRTKEVLVQFTTDDVAFLQRRDVKLIVAACGTVSSNVPARAISGLDVPFVDVISPTVEAALAATKTKRIGIIGTNATIKSGSFANRLKNLDKDVQTVSNSAQQLVSLVESGNIQDDNFTTISVCKEYLAPIKEFGVDTLILGCTHFPVLSRIIQNIMGPDVTLIDAGKEAANEVARILPKLGLDRQEERTFTEYFVTGDAAAFDSVANIFLEGTDDVASIHTDIDG